MKIKTIIALLTCWVAAAAFAADAPSASSPAPHAKQAMHRYLIERTVPAGALAGLDAKTKAKVNATNAKFGVSWITSYANADKTKTYCIYEGPNEAAIRDAAKANELPVDSIAEVPVTLTPR